jgi:general secretion pathway protein C
MTKINTLRAIHVSISSLIIASMQTQPTSLWQLRSATFLVAALAAASATFWVLKWTGTGPARAPGELVFAEAPPADPQAVARLLGGGQTGAAMAPGAPVPSAASRFKLMGVVAERGQGGYALIAIDGKPARPYTVGAAVEGALVLQSVAPRSAALAPGVDAVPAFTLELPKLSQ